MKEVSRYVMIELPRWLGVGVSVVLVHAPPRESILGFDTFFFLGLSAIARGEVISYETSILTGKLSLTNYTKCEILQSVEKSCVRNPVDA